MADSENSRTLPSNTYRNLLAVTEDFLREMAAGQGDVGSTQEHDALAKWEAWWNAHCESARLCIDQQRLEAAMYQTIKAPKVATHETTRPGPAPVKTLEEIDRWREGQVFIEIGASAKAERVTPQSEWEIADETIGYSRAKEAEDRAAAKERQHADELWATSSGSFVSAAAKLHCILAQGEPKPDCREFPWPQLRAALGDLMIMTVEKASILAVR